MRRPNVIGLAPESVIGFDRNTYPPGLMPRLHGDFRSVSSSAVTARAQGPQSADGRGDSDQGFQGPEVSARGRTEEGGRRLIPGRQTGFSGWTPTARRVRTRASRVISGCLGMSPAQLSDPCPRWLLCDVEGAQRDHPGCPNRWCCIAECRNEDLPCRPCGRSKSQGD